MLDYQLDDPETGEQFITGRDILRQIKDSYPEIKIYARTGNDSQEDHKKYLGEGFDGMISKQLNLKEVATVFSQAMERSQEEPGPDLGDKLSREINEELNRILQKMKSAPKRCIHEMKGLLKMIGPIKHHELIELTQIYGEFPTQENLREIEGRLMEYLK